MTDNDLHAGDRADLWRDYLRQKCRKQLAEIGREWPHNRSLYIDYREVIRFARVDPGKTTGEAVGLVLADEILENPGKVIEDIRDALDNNTLIKTADNKPIKKDAINIRIKGLARKVLLRDLRAQDVGKFISVEGTMSRISFVLPRLKEAVFKCPAGHFTKKYIHHGKYVEPTGCSTDGCTFKKLDLIPKRSTYTDSQIGQLQELPEYQKPGEIPHHILIDIEDDLCGQIPAVGRLTVNGILKSTQRIVRGEKSATFDLYIEVSSIEREQKSFSEIEITDEDETAILALAKDPDILTKISQSIVPAISGYDDEKKGLALQIFSAKQAVHVQMNKILRGSIHIMLAGDPGIAKSTMIRLLAQMIPRAIYISGTSGITSAGLTYAMRQDGFDNRWVVEPGAAPQADESQLFVDEIAEMEAGDIMALNGILEEQKISFAKAGMVGELNARCATTVAMNPKGGRFDPCAPLADQIPKKIPPQLLSRFDLIYLMQDTVNLTKDAKDASHILGLWSGNDYQFEVNPPIPAQMVKKFIAFMKRQPNPILNPQARKRLMDEFLELRKQSENGTVAITKRALEALVRLATAHCLMRGGKEVALQDAEIAIKTHRYSMAQTSTDPATGKFDADKVSGHTKEKRNRASTILEILRNQGGKCTREVIYREMAVKDMSVTKEKIDIILDQMAQEGAILEPKAGVVKIA